MGNTKEELLQLIEEIKSLCADRLDAITAGGLELKEVFVKIESLSKKLK